MSDVVIKAESLGKKYTIGHQANGERYTALRDVMMRSASSLWRKTKDMVSGRSIIPGDSIEEFWALKDVSFEIPQGEAVGIIGRNGAGKSTLLKVLSRITEPSAGRATIKGRVASLLEVGTGFHPELTGRENIFLNGAILGMTRREIKSKFDEIVDFAEVEKFLDTPVKRYSSGMYVRLAFAVAAHLEPEILLVDEVLAVGDAAFQKKCLGKMESVSQQGRTVMFVSHNMHAVRTLCNRGILLDSGKIEIDGMVGDVLSQYREVLGKINLTQSIEFTSEKNRRGSGKARFTSVALFDKNGKECFDFKMWETINMKLSYETFHDLPHLLVSVVLRSDSTREAVTSVKHFVSKTPIKAGTKGTVVIEFPKICIRPGEYPLYFWLGDLPPKTAQEAFDVLDDLTHPLVISANANSPSLDVNPHVRSGYFSIPSMLRNLNS